MKTCDISKVFIIHEVRLKLSGFNKEMILVNLWGQKCLLFYITLFLFVLDSWIVLFRKWTLLFSCFVKYLDIIKRQFQKEQITNYILLTLLKTSASVSFTNTTSGYGIVTWGDQCMKNNGLFLGVNNTFLSKWH